MDPQSWPANPAPALMSLSQAAALREYLSIIKPRYYAILTALDTYLKTNEEELARITPMQEPAGVSRALVSVASQRFEGAVRCLEEGLDEETRERRGLRFMREAPGAVYTGKLKTRVFSYPADWERDRGGPRDGSGGGGVNANCEGCREVKFWRE